jgi:ribulose-phosphate 3-epimerase
VHSGAGRSHFNGNPVDLEMHSSSDRPTRSLARDKGESLSPDSDFSPPYSSMAEVSRPQPYRSFTDDNQCPSWAEHWAIRPVLSYLWGNGMIDSMTPPAIISASILAADFSNLAEAISSVEAAGADWIHIDVMDAHFVPNLTMGPVVVRACRRCTQLPLDVHLMVERPEALIPAFVDAGADSLTIHVEAGPNLYRSIGQIQEAGCRAGVAINPGTDVTAVRPVLSLADMVLVMTVNPGYAGQTFIESSPERVAAVRRMRDEARSSALIQVDGGITKTTGPSTARAGAQVFVAASAIFKHPDGIQAGVQTLREALEPSPAQDRT